MFRFDVAHTTNTNTLTRSIIRYDARQFVVAKVALAIALLQNGLIVAAHAFVVLERDLDAERRADKLAAVVRLRRDDVKVQQVVHRMQVPGPKLLCPDCVCRAQRRRDERSTTLHMQQQQQRRRRAPGLRPSATAAA